MHVFGTYLSKVLFTIDIENFIAIKVRCNMTHSYKFNDFHNLNNHSLNVGYDFIQYRK